MPFADGSFFFDAAVLGVGNMTLLLLSGSFTAALTAAVAGVAFRLDEGFSVRIEFFRRRFRLCVNSGSSAPCLEVSFVVARSSSCSSSDACSTSRAVKRVVKRLGRTRRLAAAVDSGGDEVIMLTFFSTDAGPLSEADEEDEGDTTLK